MSKRDWADERIARLREAMEDAARDIDRNTGNPALDLREALRQDRIDSALAKESP